MRMLHELAQPGRRAPMLIVLLPGALQQPEDFVQAGFVAALRERQLDCDLALLDLQMDAIGDSTSGRLQQRLHRQLEQQLRLQEYAKVWLGGISIGGLIALAYAAHFPQDIDGLCLLSPYPGNRILLDDIARAGAPDCWRPPAATDDAEVRAWQWLQSYRHCSRRPEIWLGYGSGDRFAAGQRQMARAFDPEDVDIVEGGHDWAAWSRLWPCFLDRVGRPSHAAVPAATTGAQP